MKKVLAILLAVVLVASIGVVAFAKGGFISSPSGNPAPEIIDVEYLDEGSCEPRIEVTPYSERDTLDSKREKDIEDAYDEIAANKDLTKLCSELEAVAKARGLDPKVLAVSDLFDVTAYHSVPHEYCGSIKITLSSETIKHFVALIHRGSNGKWENIPDVIVDSAENTIIFSAKDFSPFAVVVDTSSQRVPDTGNMLYIPAIIMVVSAISLTGVLISLKKKKQEA